MILLLSLLFVIPALSTAKPSQANLACDTGYVKYGQHCYRLSEDAEEFELAKAQCDFDYAQIVSIHSAEENKFVSSLGEGAYIGLEYKGNGQFIWADETQVDYKNLVDGYESAAPNAGYCAKIVNGVWTNADCKEEKLYYICKKTAYDIPTTDANKCPDASNIYTNYGDLYSPGYPDGYQSTSEAPLKCYYKLKAVDGDTVVFDINEINFEAREGILNFYEGWEEAADKLIDQVNWHLDFPISTNSSNKMLIVFIGGVGTGTWAGNFYSDKRNPVTLAPGVTTTARPESDGCPKTVQWEILSPNFPYVYDDNYDCDYINYLPEGKCQDGYTCHFTWKVVFDQLNLGDDDYIELIDMGSNTVVESTKENIHEGTVIDCPFNLTFHFHSGSVKGTFNHWRITELWSEYLHRN